MQAALESFLGATHDRRLDDERFGRVDAAIYHVLEDGDWHSRRELMDASGGAAVNSSIARIRRELQTRGSTVASRRDPGDGRSGNWQYRIQEEERRG